MSTSRLKSSTKYAMIAGLFFLSSGIFLFMNFDESTKLEKLGVVFMAYGGVLIGMAYTAFVALKTK